MNNCSYKWLKLALTALLFIVVENGYSQKWKFGIEDSGKDLESGYESYKDGKYSAALKKFNKIHRNDTNYEFTVVHRIKTLSKLKRFNEGIALAKASLALNNNYKASYYEELGRLYSAMDSGSLSIQLFDDAIAEFPRYYKLRYYKAISYYNMEEYEKAVTELQNLIKENPEFPAPHFLMGKWCAEQENYAQAIMSLTTYMILNPFFEYNSEVKDQGTYECFQLLDAVCNNSIDAEEPEEEKEKVKFNRRKMDFLDIGYENMDVNIQNGVVLTKKYKTSSKIKRNIVKQIHYVMNHRKEFVKDGFWEEFYGPYFDKVIADKSFDKVMMLVNAISSEEIYYKYQKVFTPFFKENNKNWANLYSNIEIELGGEKKTWRLHFDGARIVGAGKLKEDKQVGEWYYFHYNGSQSSHGYWTDKSKRDGDWTWHHINGNLKETSSYKDGKVIGDVIAYREIGTKSYHNRYEKGEIVGPAEYYEIPGHRYGYVETNEKIKEGKVAYFYANGVTSYEAFEKNAVTEGVVKRFFPSGELKQEDNYKSGDLEGERRSYNVFGKVSTISNFKGSKREGKHQEFFENGVLKYEAEYKNGKRKSSTTYHKNGEKSIVELYNDEGKLDGLYESFDVDGIKHYDMVFKEGQPQKYTYYDKTGGVIKSAKLLKYDLMLTGYFPTGEKMVTGRYYRGKKHGTWKYYTILGLLESEIKYAYGKKDGLIKHYFSNGKIFTKENFKNGFLTGKYERYYRNGQLYCEGYHRVGYRIGEWRYYTESGVLEIKNYYVVDKMEGVQEYYTNSGKLFKTKTLKKDYLLKVVNYDSSGKISNSIDLIKDSVDMVKYWNGQDLKNIHYKNGILNGKVVWYYPDGKTEVIGQYLNGRRNGEWVDYFRDGTIKKKRFYKFGENVGVWETYYPNGKLRYSNTYEFGEESGVYKAFYSNGSISAEIDKEDGKSHGLAKYYNKEGLLTYSKLYEEGIVVAFVTANKDTLKVGKEERVYKLNDKDGKLAAEFTLVNGVFHGSFKVYYSNGKIQKDYQYDMGKYNGENKNYSKMGILLSSLNFLNGEYHGTCKEFHSNGKLKEVSNYLVGDLFGPLTIHSLSGKVTKTIYYYNDNIAGEK